LRVWIRRGLGLQLQLFECTIRHGASRGGVARRWARVARRSRQAIQQPRVDDAVDENRGDGGDGGEAAMEETETAGEMGDGNMEMICCVAMGHEARPCFVVMLGGYGCGYGYATSGMAPSLYHYFSITGRHYS